jgi:hypothetical protein
MCNSCTISPSLDIDLFDHKSIKLSFSIKGTSSRHFVNPSIFSHPRFQAVVAVAAVETYLQHARGEQPDVNIPGGLAQIGRIIKKILDANEIEFDISFTKSTELKELNLLGINREIELLISELPDPELLNNIILECTPDLFLEVLLGNIRNSLISFQAWIKKVKNAKISSITRSLNELKRDYVNNAEAIFDLESQLCSIRDKEIGSFVQEIKLFEHLHNEKPSPLFLRLI